jgi:hypothetical protein
MIRVLKVDDRVKNEEHMQVFRKGTKMTIREVDTGIRIEFAEFNSIERAMADRREFTIPFEFVISLNEALTEYINERLIKENKTL